MALRGRQPRLNKPVLKAELNKLDVAGYALAFSNGNRTIENTDGGYSGTVGYARTTTGSTVPFYFEYVVTSSNLYWVSAGILGRYQDMTTLESSAPNKGIAIIGNGDFYSDNLGVYSAYGTNVSGDTICVAVDPVNGRLWARRNNGNWNNSSTANPATNVGGINIAALGKELWVSASSSYIGGVFTGNFKSTDWTYAAPSGFVALDAEVDEDGWDITRASTPSAFQLGNGDRYVTRTVVSVDETIQSKWAKSSGKWYYEVLWTESTGYASGIGFVNSDYGPLGSNDYLGEFDSEGCFNDNTTWGGANAGYSPAPFNDGDIVCFALDLDNNRSWIRKNNGSWYGVNSTPGDPAANSGGHVLEFTGTLRAIIQLNDPSTRPIAVSAFKESQWTYAAPSGFSAPVDEATTHTITTGGATGFVRAPVGTTSVKIQVWGGGGGGTGGGWGGGGGGYAEVTLTATDYDEVYYAVGAGGVGVTTNSTITASLIGDSSWARIGTNSRPTSATEGAAAPGGYGGTYEFGSDGTTRIGGSGAGVNTSLINDDPDLIDVETFVGTTTYNGGSASLIASWAGGGGGAGSAGNGSTSGSGDPSTGGAGGSPDGGVGGVGSTTVPTAGTPPGGGGGSGDASPGGQNGGAGRVVITFYSTEVATAFPYWQPNAWGGYPQAAGATPTDVNVTGVSATGSVGTVTVVAYDTSAGTWNPSDKDADIVLSGSNMVSDGTGVGFVGAAVRSTNSITGKKYWEIDASAVGQEYASAGILNGTSSLDLFLNLVSSTSQFGVQVVGTASPWDFIENWTGAYNGSGSTATGILCFAVDETNKKLWFRSANGSWSPSGDPAAGTGGYDISTITGTWYAAAASSRSGAPLTARFSDASWSYSAPSGFTELSSSTPANVNVTGVAGTGSVDTVTVNAFDTTGTALDPSKKSTSLTLSYGNRTATATGSGDYIVLSVDSSSSKFYYEVDVGSSEAHVGIANGSLGSYDDFLGSGSNSLQWSQAGQIIFGGSVQFSTGNGYTSGDRVGIAIDPVNKLIWFRKNNGAWVGDGGTGDPAAGTFGWSFAALNSGPYFAALQTAATAANATFRFSSASWVDTVPSGFIALSSSTPANVNVTGVAATGSVGNATATGRANTTITAAASATGNVGTATATGRANTSVTGLGATGSVGSATGSGAANTTVTGLSATGSVGTVTVDVPATTVSVTGLAATGEVGTATATGIANTSVTGLSATGSVGSATGSGAATATVTGLSATAAVGSVTAGVVIGVSVTGLGATGSVGSATATGRANTTVTGLGATGAVGTAEGTSGGLVTVTGLGATGSVGTVTSVGRANTTVTGLGATASVGTITVEVPATLVSVTGLTATGSVGTVSTVGRANTTVTGLGSTASVGTVTVFTATNTTVTGLEATGSVGNAISTSVELIAPTGVSATGEVGEVTVVAAANTTLTGVSATGAVGTVTISLPRTVTVTGLGATGAVGEVDYKATVRAEVTGLEAQCLFSAAIVWGTVVPIQAPSWNEVEPAQSPNWTEVTPSQNPNWT